MQRCRQRGLPGRTTRSAKNGELTIFRRIGTSSKILSSRPQPARSPFDLSSHQALHRWRGPPLVPPRPPPASHATYPSGSTKTAPLSPSATCFAHASAPISPFLTDTARSTMPSAATVSAPECHAPLSTGPAISTNRGRRDPASSCAPRRAPPARAAHASPAVCGIPRRCVPPHRGRRAFAQLSYGESLPTSRRASRRKPTSSTT